MKNGRLFELLYLLVERRALTAGELAERFEVSERTIYRDVDALSAAGVPVYTQRGQGGGIRLMDQFVLDRCLLSPREQDEVLFALRALLSTGGLEGAEALERLSALFRREEEGWVEVDFTAAAPVLTGQVSLSLKLYQLLWLGLHFGLRALSTYVNHRNRHKQQREAV
mgnify:FL=1